MSVSLAVLRPRIAGSTWDNSWARGGEHDRVQGQAAKESDGPEGSGSSLHTALVACEQKIADRLLGRPRPDDVDQHRELVGRGLLGLPLERCSSHSMFAASALDVLMGFGT